MIAKLRETSQSLTFRIAALLALALLPIGLISVATTFQLLRQADRKAETNLLALTSEAAAPEESFVRTGIGAATMFASMIPGLKDTDWDCQVAMRNFVEQSEAYIFAGYVTADGTIECASDGEGMDVSSREIYKDMVADPRMRVTVAPEAAVSRTSVVLIGVPVISNGAFDGYVAVSLPHGALFRPLDEISADRPLNLLTYNSDAEPLTASGGLDTASQFLPANVALEDLVVDEELAFIDYTRNGDLRVFAVVPIVEGQVFALGSWAHERNAVLEGLSITSSMFFPIAMWLVCLGVAFFAVQRMVIRPTRNLRARMLQFMRSRRLTEPKDDRAVPRELRDMEDTWMRLAENVLHDEAELYDTIHQRTVLLKEVHHRVKNNLQLIVSILNMKVRNAERGSEVRYALGDIRDRVMGIARVHQNLYETSTAERVHVGELLRTIVTQIVQSGISHPEDIDFTEHYDDIVVYPDQAVPLALAVTELLTNALKHFGDPQQTRPSLSVSLNRDGENRAKLVVCNSICDQPTEGEPPAGSGLGLALVTAFSQQIEGTAETEQDEEQFCVTLRFPIAEFVESDLPAELALAE
ncbi:sensor histidine kinase [Pseudoruegeria sp. HB172150]|uniref:sensor histidine kinase n=1 Tax=Pseudoruegeria sp. HB172150 TaxID=2721164 RepID=UPI0015524C8A|nr:sensor histidine kinase [Pseudoruegeria sp. HB172150]